MRESPDPTTRLAHSGRHPARDAGLVNTPVYRGSTVLFPTLDALEAATARPYEGVFYGRFGTPTRFDFEAAVAEADGQDDAVAVCSGLAACVVAILSQVQAGDRVLVPDSVYWPTRHVCDTVLARFGVETAYYDPLLGGDIRAQLTPNTRVLFLESPGSLSFEVQDVPALCAVAREAGCVTVLDNTWATPLGFDAAGHGVDLVVHAATKYIVGHSDAMLGTVSGPQAQIDRVRRTAQALGHSASPDDCWLGLRGLRTLAVRLRQHADTARRLCDWLDAQPEVVAIRWPAWPQDPGHAIWRRDFTAASGLFSVMLRPCPRAALAAMLDGMALFAMGYSWGGYESLMLPVKPGEARSVTDWTHEGPTLRIHVGLEAADDLIADLDAGFERLRGRG